MCLFVGLSLEFVLMNMVVCVSVCFLFFVCFDCFFVYLCVGVCLCMFV